MTKPKGKQAVSRIVRLELSVPEALARSYLDFMRLAHAMGNLNSALSPRDRLDMVVCGALMEALGIREQAPAQSKGKAT